MKMKNIVIILVILALAGGIGYYIWSDLTGQNIPILPNDNENITDTSQTSTTTETNQGQNIQNISIPDLDRLINITTQVTEDQKKAFTEKIQELSEDLKEKEDFETWNRLAALRRTIGAHEGAREIWIYMNAIYPDNYVSRVNLADLYGYYLKDNENADKYYREVIEIEPSYVVVYIDFHNFYIDTGRSELADDILLEGLNNNPNDINLLATLAEYYRDIEDVANSTKYYNLAISQAERKGDTEVASALKQGLAELK